VLIRRIKCQSSELLEIHVLFVSIKDWYFFTSTITFAQIAVLFSPSTLYKNPTVIIWQIGHPQQYESPGIEKKEKTLFILKKTQTVNKNAPNVAQNVLQTGGKMQAELEREN